jgi:hypothetical protein
VAIIIGSVLDVVIEVRRGVAEIVCTSHIGHNGKCLREAVWSAANRNSAVNGKLTAPGLPVVGESERVPKRRASGQNNGNWALVNEARPPRDARIGRKLTRMERQKDFCSIQSKNCFFIPFSSGDDVPQV